MKQQISCFGSNFAGQMGIEALQLHECSSHAPREFGISSQYSLDADSVKDIACGSQCSIILKKDGSILACGSINGTIYQYPTPVEVLYPLKCMQIACGRKHALALMTGGYVLSWGVGYFGQLGHGDDGGWDKPKMINFLEPSRTGTLIVKVACGGSHSAALGADGKLFMWGLNRNGQCGVGMKSDSLMEPRLVKLDYQISLVVCGRSHTAVLLKEGGRVFTWGAGTFGRLGLLDVSKSQLVPLEIPFFRDNPALSIAAGDFHMLALCRASTGASGAVFAWGQGCDGQLGQGAAVEDAKTPVRIRMFDNLHIVSIACGPAWSFALTQTGRMYAWGLADGGWLGIGPPPAKLRLLEGEVASSILNSSQFVKSFDADFVALQPQLVRRPGVLVQENVGSNGGVNTEAMANSEYFVVDKIRCGGAHTILFLSRQQPALPSQPSSPSARGRQQQQDPASSLPALVPASTRRSNGDSTPRLVNILGFVKSNDAVALESMLSGETMDVNANWFDVDRKTPLMYACCAGYWDVARVLVERGGADVNLADDLGNTALHYCFCGGYEDLGAYLIAKGADEFAINNEGLTCYEGLTHEDLASRI